MNTTSEQDAVAGGLPALSLSGVTKKYSNGWGKSVAALKNATLTAKQGEIFGFLGPNGAGKTTLIKILVGLHRQDSGTANILGHACGTREAKRKLGYLPERPYYHEFLTAREFLKFHGGLLGLAPAEIAEKTPKLLERVGLARAIDQRLRTFSKGMLQRVGLAQALLHDPQVLILDEPMSGLDPVGRREVRDLITEVAAAGKTIFFSTHIIHDVEVICDTVGYITGGVIQGAGNIEELLGKTVRSTEVRFDLPAGLELAGLTHARDARKTMDGFLLELTGEGSSVTGLDEQVDAVVREVLERKGRIRAVLPRKRTLEDLFFEAGAGPGGGPEPRA